MPPPTRRAGRPSDTAPPDPRMPVPAIAAAVLGIAGAMPPAFLAVIAVALGGLSADSGPDPWTYLIVVAPVLQVWAALWLLIRRSWLFLVLAVLPVAVLTGAVIWAGAQAEDVGGSGWPLLLLVLPIAAAVLAQTPRVRRWVAGRPQRTRRAG
ncbi:hypothetical protein GCU56_11710 [Geodermatophilus sabuli]|uniref:Uncharacterized protein n=1 Tax=Geodermatophilus sabuli TaxID=1564158 RepID=A0A7K3W101_9ACTN|nr:hypothetical protein [Geodermatophilus sabuli]NEK58535.1 hypothetical protein [Geodermatophilus sabuli]